MLDTQENKFSMYRVAEKLLDDNSIIWNGTPAIVTIKGAFSAKITAIHTASQQQQAIITGISTDKNVLKASLVDLSFPVAAAVIAYATQENNNELLDSVNFTHTQLLKTRDDMLGDRCQIIHDKANANLVALADYGITAPVLTALQNGITAYNVKVPAPGTAKVSKKTATLNLANLFKQTDVILKMQLDNLMLPFKVSNPDFYKDYLGARVVYDLGAVHTKLRVEVKAEDNAFIKGAVASLLQNNLVKYSLGSDAKGILMISKIKPGTYDLKVSKDGFTTKTETAIKFVAGKSVRRIVTLVAGSSNPANGTAVREGDLAMGIVANISLVGINGTAQTTVTIEAKDSNMRVYASATNNGTPGAVFFDVSANTSAVKLSSDLAALIGLDDTNKFLMVQNTGVVSGHYTFTFNNLEV